MDKQNIDNWARVAIICETSGTLRELFREAGHETISCDVLPADDLSPNDRHHWQGDAVEFLEGFEDGHFSLIIAHPPCQYLAVSGNAHHANTENRANAMKWTEDLWHLAKRKAKRVAFENPVGVLGHTSMGKATQYFLPWQFGEPESKKTGLWLHNLPAVEPTCVLPLPECGYWENQTPSGQNKLAPSPDRWKIRSKTYMGVAQAIRDQFSKIL